MDKNSPAKKIIWLKNETMNLPYVLILRFFNLIININLKTTTWELPETNSKNKMVRESIESRINSYGGRLKMMVFCYIENAVGGASQLHRFTFQP